MPSALGGRAGGARYLITTADDFGLTEEINLGIIEAHTKGILRSTALLMNGQATEHALRLRRQHPGLEVGIHLGLVEGLSLLGRDSSLTDELRYFGDRGICLHRGWPQFLRRYLSGRISLAELEAELEAQLLAARDALGGIAFANGTQHLHVLPGVANMVLKLLKKYEVPCWRLAQRSRRVPGGRRRRGANLALMAFSRWAAARASTLGIASPRYFAGFDACGQLDASTVCALLEAMPEGTMELMSHPGHDCAHLRAELPWAYDEFAWEGELAALTSDAVRATVARRNITLIQFKDLPALL